MIEMKNCDDEESNPTPIFKVVNSVENSTLQILKNCGVISNSCIEVKPFETFNIKVTMSTADGTDLGVTKFDFCKKKELQGMLKVQAMMFGFPLTCSVAEETTNCYSEASKLISNGLTQRFFLIASKFPHINIKMETQHDTGTSCLSGKFSIKKR